MPDITILISNNTDPEGAKEEADEMFDESMPGRIVLHPNEDGAYEAADTPDGVTVAVEEV